jgi:hypothetical protein
MLRIKHQTKTTEMKKTIRRISAGAFAVGVFVTSFGTSQAAVTYASLLLPGATITSGDKLFSNFSQPTQGGDLSVSLNDIFVSAIQYNGNYGIRFQAGGWELSSPNQTYSMVFSYEVSVTDPCYLIDGSDLLMVAGHTGPGEAEVDMDVFGPGMSDLGDNYVFLNTGAGTDLYDSSDYSPNGYSSLTVFTGLDMTTGSDPGVGVDVTAFQQTFAQTLDMSCIPEPTSVLSTALLLTSGMLVRRRGKHLA